MSKIMIEWQINQPPVSPESWYFWKSLVAISPHPIEKFLAWPDGTIAVLEKAFSQGLSRKTGWDLSQIDDSKRNKYLCAASIFRRGVAIRPENKAERRPDEGSYAITFWSSMNSMLQSIDKDDFLVVDSQISLLWDLPRDPDVELTACESKKNLATVKILTEKWRKQESRHWNIFGGGLIADTAAMAAVLNNCTFTLFPTTLLAMADACVGGKTGVNFQPFGKNQLGFFAFPRAVQISAQWLKTLPQDQIRSGVAECLKHSFLTGNTSLAENLSQASANHNTEALVYHLPEVVKVKADVVAQDATEKGIRATLNFGHTLGHALESISHQVNISPLLHGEAVAWGMIYASFLSVALTGLPEQERNFIISCIQKSQCIGTGRDLLKRLNLLNRHDFPNEFFHFIKQDKKMTTDTEKSQWVLLKALGKPYNKNGHFASSVEFTDLEKAWHQMLTDPQLKF